MKKFIIAAAAVIVAVFIWNTAYYRLGLYIDLHPDAQAEALMTVEGKEIYIQKNGEKEPFEMRGVDMGSGIPGEWSADYAIDEETYLRWFGQIQDMGANTIRVYTLLADDFYHAFYEYNKDREEPLYLVQGVWVNDYIQYSHRDAYDEEFRQTFLDDCRTVVDALHGRRTVSLGYGKGSGSYRKDVSSWVIGYILGVEWEDVTVEYTNKKYPERNSYQGEYLYTSETATPFEAMLCEVGDKLLEYESGRYKQQKLFAFSNGPATDPFVYPGLVTQYHQKCAQVNVENIRMTDAVLSGQFASYHVYPYFPSYLDDLGGEETLLGDDIFEAELSDSEILEQIRIRAEEAGKLEGMTEDEIQALVENEKEEMLSRRESAERIEKRNEEKESPQIEDYLHGNDLDPDGDRNMYYTYLRILNEYHTMPVIISEFGIPTSRGMSQRDLSTNRNRGYMSEEEQAEGLVECWQDIKDAGCSGGMVFSWQDEWDKRTWNTMHAVDLDNTAYWSDWQTNEQSMGILTFDPGDEESVCYVDGDITEWGEEDVAAETECMTLSMKYDEKFLYFLIWKEDFNKGEDTLYIPIDITPKTGSTYCQDAGVSFERAADFLMVIDGTEDSRVLVQERYDVLQAMYSREIGSTDAYLNPPDADSPVFHQIHLILQSSPVFKTGDFSTPAETYETGKLRYGNGNPEAAEFDSLADFLFSGEYTEIRLPWQLLNFSNPSEMQVHDDYYECYGVENIKIDEMYVGIGAKDENAGRISMEPFGLEGWGTEVTYHERLKKSYDALQTMWTDEKAQEAEEGGETDVGQ